MNFLKTLAAAATLGAAASAASAATLDFEGTLLPAEEMRNLGTSAYFAGAGITFSTTAMDYLQLARVGGTASAFVPMDNVDPTGGFGEIFLSGDFSNLVQVKMNFDTLVNSLKFDIADIDGRSPKGDLTETFTVTAYKGGSAVGSVSVTAGDPLTGSSDITPFELSGFSFDEVEIIATTPGGKRRIGWGLDNIQVAAVPLPAGMVLMMSALGALGLVRRRKATAA